MKNSPACSIIVGRLIQGFTRAMRNAFLWDFNECVLPLVGGWMPRICQQCNLLVIECSLWAKCRGIGFPNESCWCPTNPSHLGLGLGPPTGQSPAFVPFFLHERPKYWKNSFLFLIVFIYVEDRKTDLWLGFNSWRAKAFFLRVFI